MLCNDIEKVIYPVGTSPTTTTWNLLLMFMSHELRVEKITTNKSIGIGNEILFLILGSAHSLNTKSIAIRIKEKIIVDRFDLSMSSPIAIQVLNRREMKI